MRRQKAQLAQFLSEAVRGLRTNLREEEGGVFVYGAGRPDSIAHVTATLRVNTDTRRACF